MSILLDGATNYIRRDISGDAISHAAAWTLAGWVKRTTDTNNFGGALMLHADLVLNNATRGQIFTDSGNDNFIGGMTGNNATTGPAITTDVWTYVALKSGGSPHSDTFYYSLVGDPSMTLQGSIVSSHSGSFNYLTVGCLEDATLFFRGSFCHVRAWEANLTAGELLTERDSTTPVKATGLYLSWPLANVSDTTDQSGNGYTPTITGGSTDSDEPISAGGSIAPLMHYYKQIA